MSPGELLIDSYKIIDGQLNNNKTRMITFIKTNLKKSDDLTNIDKYRVAANITENHIISKLIRYIVPNCIRNHHTEFQFDRTI